ncbi:MAG: LysM peptidoglycan-binding domain-containing protein [Rhizomicrobium sp.]
MMGRVTDYVEKQGSTRVYERTAQYDSDSLVTNDSVYALQSDNQTSTQTSTHYDYMVDVNVDGVYGDSNASGTDVFSGGSATHELTTTVSGSSSVTSDSKFDYQQNASGGIVEQGEAYNPDTRYNTVNTSWLTYDPRWNLHEANIQDGHPRDVVYLTNLSGEIVQRDTGTNSGNGPHARFYYFGGMAMGDVSDDGTSNVNYAQSIIDHRKKPGTGLFQFGSPTGTPVGEFDLNYDTINGLTYGSAPTEYTVQSGDTLQSIAQQVWSDANFWYLIANANGLDSTSTLDAGDTLIIPNRIADNQNSNSTYAVYDPNKATGNVSPTVPPKPHSNSNCGRVRRDPHRGGGDCGRCLDPRCGRGSRWRHHEWASGVSALARPRQA